MPNTPVYQLDADYQSKPYRWKHLDHRWTFNRNEMSMQTQRNDYNSSGLEVPLPNMTEAWLQYDVWFDDERTFGRRTAANMTGGKMPGLGSKGRHDRMNGNHTGGHHDDQGFSTRLMWKGWRSDGNGHAYSDGIRLVLYLYDKELADKGGYGRDMPFKKDPAKAVNPPEFESAGGTGPEGIGDKDSLLIEPKRWYTITMGHGIERGNHWYRAYVDGQLALELSGPGFKFVADDARQEIDTFLFQTYWGGKGSKWQPDGSYGLKYRNVAVYPSSPLEDAPAVDAARPGTYTVYMDLEGRSGEERVTLVNSSGTVGGFTLSKGLKMYSVPNVKSLEGLALVFVNDGPNRDVIFGYLSVWKDVYRVTEVFPDNPQLWTDAGYDKNGPLIGSNADVGHRGRMYINGRLEFRMLPGWHIPEHAAPEPIPVPEMPPVPFEPPAVQDWTVVQQIEHMLDGMTAQEQVEVLADVLSGIFLP